METLQFCAVVMLALLTFELVLLLPRRVVANKILNRSRWFFATGVGLLAIQFLIQYIFGFRAMGVTQAVLINILFFVPCSIVFSMGMLNLQQQGRIERRQRAVATGATVSVWTLLGLGTMLDGTPLQEGSSLLRAMEYVSGLVYCAMQIYFSYSILRNDRRLHRTMNNYYDHFTGGMLRWMRRVVFMITLLAIGVPFLIFSSGILLLIYSVTIFLTIYYMVTCFTFYCVSNDAREVMEAEEAADETAADEAEKAPSLSKAEKEDIARCVEQWVAKGGYLQPGLTIPKVAEEMGLPRYQLVIWLKGTEWELFTPWLTSLRIEEAKRLLRNHQDWTNDAIARQCGFSSRNYFQNVFKKTTGITPAQFIETITI